ITNPQGRMLPISCHEMSDSEKISFIQFLVAESNRRTSRTTFFNRRSMHWVKDGAQCNLRWMKFNVVNRLLVMKTSICMLSYLSKAQI
ncbi:MAG: hypothetical protein RR206_09090, partial [Bacteroidaceae bacterium]